LRPKGQVNGFAKAASASGQTQIAASWPFVELWKLSAQEMIALREPGLVPWITLMASSEPPEKLLKECRQVVDERAKQAEIDNILAVSQVFASLRYNEQWLFNFFGGKEAMIESPYLNSIVEEQLNIRIEKITAQITQQVTQQVTQRMLHQMRIDVLRILKGRFGAALDDVRASLDAVTDQAELDALADYAVSCPDLDAFRQRLPH
jgi:hypothetical protein